MRPETRRSKELLLTAAVVLSIIVLFAGEATAQQATAKIVGTITDPQGAVVPDVQVTVTNAATNVRTETTTDKDGFYQVLNLPIGVYRITARREGFRTLETATPPLEINQTFRADLRLQLGTATEQVLVEARASGVETVNPTIGQSITSRPIVDLPLNGRNVLSLALLQPGVTEDNPDDTGAGSISQNGGNFNVAGGRSDSITFLLDGGLNNELLGNGVVYNPNPDSVAEFRILTSNYTAEYGRNAAGVVSVVTKSGSNQFHGSAFEFLRNTAFDANSYFNKQAGIPRNNLKRNQFGGTVGGPIVKSRLFFFASYQGQQQIETEVLPEQTTFTPEELNGDFSHAANGGPDLNVAAFLQTNTYFQSNPTLAAQAIIDPLKIDPAAQAYIGLGLIPTSPNGELFPSDNGTNNNNELTGKIDFDITTKDRLTGTVGGIRTTQLQPFGYGSNVYSATVPGFASTNQINNYFLNLAYTRTFSPALLNELRLTAQRHNTILDKPVTVVTTAPKLGFGIASDLANGPPLMSFDNGLTFGPDQAGPAHEAGNTYAIGDTVTWVRGHNTWKFGAGFSAYQQNTVYAFFTDSNFFFLGPYSQGGAGTGNSFADFLVGAPNNLFEGPNAHSNIRSKATYAFVQDEWRAKPNLTLTLGIRYEYNTPKLDTQGRTFSVVPGAQSTKFPSAPLGLVFPGDPGAPRGVNFPDKDNFAPRIGFAWSPRSSGKMSVRGGFGIFYDVLKGEDNLQFNGAPPFYSEPFTVFPCLPSTAPTNSCTNPPQTTAGLPFYSQPWTSTGFSSNPFPSTPPDPATAFNPATGGQFLPVGGGGIYFVNPHLHTPYTYQYNLSVQNEIAKNLVLELNYVGSSSKGLTALRDVSPFILGTTTRLLNQNQTPEMTAFCLANFGGPAGCPFADALEFSNVSFANFNSLEASLTKQLGDTPLGALYFTFAYTYGHIIDNASGFRNRDSQVPSYNIGQFRASSNFDLTHRITVSGGWDLPFQRAWASGPKRLVNGWSLYPIFSWRTGFPLSILAGIPSSDLADPGPSGAGDGYLANAVFAPGFSSISILDPKTNGNLYFNPAAFICDGAPCVPTSGYGLPRDFFRGPGRTNLDLALAKTTAITEQVNVEFRVEAFNVFNHTQFANPDTNINSGTFGQITSTTFGTGVAALQTQRILQLALRLTF
ncbi:MAG TPA: carboxypeptidase regulatory-like domain-containing protein [Terriglobales bacterium]|nr:carboxypeptidase regulatory-like domain-containing protein [Terriglobales bacterium]